MRPFYQAQAISISLRARVCHPTTRTHVRLLGPCFKTGRTAPSTARSWKSSLRRGRAPRESSTRGPLGDCRSRSNGVPAGGARTDRAHPGGARPPGRRQSGSLASNDFTYYFTFFSKFFSSFPHGTCALSVSSKYLALDGHYHPVGAAVPSNTTHGKGSWWGRPHGTGL